MSVYGEKGPICMESGRLDTVHPAPYIVDIIFFIVSYGSDKLKVNTAFYHRRLSGLLVLLA